MGWLWFYGDKETHNRGQECREREGKKSRNMKERRKERGKSEGRRRRRFREQ